jgi:hypothetical protein
VPDLEHVSTEIGQVSEEFRERPRLVGQPAAERQVAARGGEAVPEQLGQQRKMMIALTKSFFRPYMSPSLP